jgi:hypothetical protein
MQAMQPGLWRPKMHPKKFLRAAHALDVQHIPVPLSRVRGARAISLDKLNGGVAGQPATAKDLALAARMWESLDIAAMERN